MNWQRLRRLLAFAAPRRATGADPSRTAVADSDRYGASGAQARRIATMVGSQLEGAGVPAFRQWQPYLGFILGYVDALADLHAGNGGHRAQGPESAMLRRSVLQLLCGDAQADALTSDLVEPRFRSSECFQRGGASALDDYDHWSDRPMAGMETFVDEARARLQRLAPQPEIDRRNAPEPLRSTGAV